MRDNDFRKDNSAIDKVESIINGDGDKVVQTQFEKVDGVVVENKTVVKTDGEKVKKHKKAKQKMSKAERADRLAAERQAKMQLKAEKHAAKMQLKRQQAEHKAEMARQKAEKRAEMKKAKAEERAYFKRVQAERRQENKIRKEERKERRGNSRRSRGLGGWIATVVALGCTALVLGSLLALSLFTDFMEFNKVNTNSASTQRSFYDFVGYVDNIETNMSKIFVSSDSQGQQKILGDIVVQSSLADASLAALPIKDESKYLTSKYINQLADYAKYLNNRLIDGQKITETEKENFKKLYEVNRNLKTVLTELSASINQNYDFSALAKNDANDQIISQFNELENGAMEYPEMIYDGPFSDGGQGKAAKAIVGDEITELDAEQIFSQIFAVYGVEKVEVQGMVENGAITCYNLSANTEQNGEVFAQISKVGGKLVMFNAYRDCNEIVVSEEECVKIAEDFLQKLGLSDMVCVWSYTTGATQYLNFAYDKGGVIVYPDQIKVKVCRQRGVVSGIDADGYYMNHTDRQIEDVEYTLGQAYEKVSRDLEIRSSAVTIIPTGGGNEKVAYEFIGDYCGETYYIYIDAQTLKQADVFKVVNTEQGRLLL